MNVVDSSGWLEYFSKGKHSSVYAPLIQDSANLLVPVVCIYEVFKRITQMLGEEEALKAIGLMCTGQVVDLTMEVTLQAAEFSMKHKLPMAYTMILATANQFDATLWTQDAHFKDLAGVEYLT